MDLPRQALLDLLELQKIDSTIDRLEARRRNLPEQAELEALEQRLGEVERSVGDQQAEVDDTVGRQKKLEGDIDLISQKIAAEEARLYSGSINSPKELSALQAELESLRRRKSSLEDSDLEIMEEREGKEKELQRLTEEQTSLRASTAEWAEKRDRAATDIDLQLTEARASREQWVPKFDRETIEFYDGLRAQRGGIAIAALEAGTCQGCHMKLPAQEYEKVRQSSGLVYCDECRRILVPI